MVRKKMTTSYFYGGSDPGTYGTQTRVFAPHFSTSIYNNSNDYNNNESEDGFGGGCSDGIEAGSSFCVELGIDEGSEDDCEE